MFFEGLSAEDAVAQGQCEAAEVLVVDPPRQGLDAGVLQLLAGTHEAKANSEWDCIFPLIDVGI